jgi:hypothetical protein
MTPSHHSPQRLRGRRSATTQGNNDVMINTPLRHRLDHRAYIGTHHHSLERRRSRRGEDLRLRSQDLVILYCCSPFHSAEWDRPTVPLVALGSHLACTGFRSLRWLMQRADIHGCHSGMLRLLMHLLQQTRPLYHHPIVRSLQQPDVWQHIHLFQRTRAGAQPGILSGAITCVSCVTLIVFW